MIIKDRSFPHPVLAPFRDDVAPNSFDFEVRVGSDADNYYIDCSFRYSNETLTGLIDSSHAIHAVHFECRRNFYRELFLFSETMKRVTIRASDIVGRIEVTGFIKARKPIPEYVISGSHPDYGSSKFQVKIGDVLAVGNSCTFDAYCDYDPLRKISSILTIRRSEEVDEGPMEVGTNEDRIVATLSRKDYDRYTDLKGDPSLGPLLANQVVVPAILEGLYEIKSVDDDELDDQMTKRWFRSLRKKLDDEGMDVRRDDVSTVQAVQKVLQLPLRRSLEGLLQIDPTRNES